VEMETDVVPSPAWNILLALPLFKYIKAANTISHDTAYKYIVRLGSSKSSSIGVPIPQNPAASLVCR
jgi:hypothetical protein